MGMPREAVAELLLPAFLPFNLIKGSINTAVTLLLYKPGYDTVLDAGGSNLSGGQRQRIAIARAFLKDSPICAYSSATPSNDRLPPRLSL